MLIAGSSCKAPRRQQHLPSAFAAVGYMPR
jgi:hypothetical protein